jgi:hypothetical protein
MDAREPESSLVTLIGVVEHALARSTAAFGAGVPTAASPGPGILLIPPTIHSYGLKWTDPHRCVRTR